MNYLQRSQNAPLHSPIMLVAFSGWPDAAEGASGALKYLVGKLSAKQFAHIDPEEFYDFTNVRPTSQVDSDGNRDITWPINDFYAYDSGELDQDLLIFIGVEPNLKWRTYSGIVADIAKEHCVKQVIILGTLMDAVPHTRNIKVTAGSTDKELQKKLLDIGVRPSSYEGPTGISTAISQTLISRNIRCGSIWGHCPHYIQVDHYPKLSLALLEKLEDVLGHSFDLKDLHSTEATFEQEFRKALGEEAELMTYVQRLEQRYDASSQMEQPLPTPEEMVSELEEFLKRRLTSDDTTSNS
ncbi:PAC2 family protein [Dehalococcoidia bacterium]|nr:PAC2 family protein [Dehalococcoidia bacterium]